VRKTFLKEMITTGALLLTVGAMAAMAQTITSFDPAGSTNTFPTAINLSGTVAGYYIDSGGAFRGMLRDSSGNFTIFNPPSDVNGTVTLFSLNNSGVVVGAYTKSSVQTGFMRDAAGNFTDISPAGATLTGVLIYINNNGVVAGSYSDASHASHGFVRDAAGNYTTFDIAGATSVNVAAIDDTGEIGGFYADASFHSHGFFRDKKGTISTFDGPTGTTNLTVYSMDSGGDIVGTYSTDSGATMHGFIRSMKGGKFVSFDADPAMAITLPFGISPSGIITGMACTTSFTSCEGFIRNPPAHGQITGTGTVVTFSIPNAVGTEPNAVNDSGAVTGPWIDNLGQFARHGFIRQ
jgi:hypothetical protein